MNNLVPGHHAARTFKQKLRHFALAAITLFSAQALAVTNVSVSSLAELATAAQASDQVVTMTPGVYTMGDYLTQDIIDANLASGIPLDTNSFIEFSGSDNTFIMTGVEIKIDTALMWELGDLKYASEFYLSGDNIEIQALTVTDEVVDTNATAWDAERLEYVTKNAGQQGINTFQLGGTDNTLKDVTIETQGGSLYGVGNFCGKGANSNINNVDMRKHSAINVRLATNATIDGLTLDHNTYGHGIHIHDSSNTSVKNSYLEAAVRGADDMKTDTSGCFYDNGFKSVWTDTVPDNGQMKSLSEDGVRTYSQGGSVTIDNVHVKHFRSCFSVRQTSSAVINGGRAEACEIGIYSGKNDQIGQTTPVEVDALYGPAVVMETGNPQVNVLLRGDESSIYGPAYLALVQEYGDLQMHRYNNEQRTIDAKVRIGSWYQTCVLTGSPCPAAPVGFVENAAASDVYATVKVGMPVRMESTTDNCHVTTEVGTNAINKGSNNSRTYE